MARVVHFQIPADDPERAAKFYEEVFGWSAKKWEGPSEYWLISTGDEKEPGIDGGLTRREGSVLSQSITNTVDVASVDKAVQAVEANGGEIILPKSPVHGVGWLAYFKDTEGNVLGMMERDESARHPE